jgi:hypothetical protein
MSHDADRLRFRGLFRSVSCTNSCTHRGSGARAPGLRPAADARHRIDGLAQYRRKLIAMSEPACDLPADSPAVAAAVENARHGVITHLTVRGERVAAIVPEKLIEALRAVEDAEDIAEADAAMDEPGESVPWEQVKAELGL